MSASPSLMSGITNIVWSASCRVETVDPPGEVNATLTFA